MSALLSCLNKDRIEIIRKKKNIVLILLLVGCMTMVLLTTKFMPVLLQKAMSVSNILSDDTSLTDFMGKFFPNGLKESLGVFSSDVGVFYSVLVICLTFNLLPHEIETGKLILPICAGYSKNIFFLSKQITYGFFCAAPVIPVYLLYYFIASGFLSVNIAIKYVIINAILLALIEFLISSITISLSVIYRRKYLSVVSVVSVVVIFPDFLTLFSFGKYLPTYILTYVYSSSVYPATIVIPLIESILILIILDIIVLKKKFSIDIDERR